MWRGIERRLWQELLSGSQRIRNKQFRRDEENKYSIPVDDVRDKIVNFVQMIPFGDFKVVLLDEADYFVAVPIAQAALRGVMEEQSTTARFKRIFKR